MSHDRTTFRPAAAGACWLRAGWLAVCLGLGTPAFAGPVTLDTWWQFGFDTPGAAVTGCDPADPAGPFCLPSSGAPTAFLDAPTWTFTAPAGGASLRVVDAFLSGEVFQVFDGGVLLGSTSAPTGGVDCGDDPVVCLATAGMSQASFQLGAGAHALSLVVSDLPSGLGSAYLQITARDTPAVPEPGALALVLAALAALAGTARRTCRRLT